MPQQHHKYQYVVICRTCGIQPLKYDDYIHQLQNPNARWICPICHDIAAWDDECLETNPSDYQQDSEDLVKDLLT